MLSFIFDLLYFNQFFIPWEYFLSVFLLNLMGYYFFRIFDILLLTFFLNLEYKNKHVYMLVCKLYKYIGRTRGQAMMT